MDDGKTDGSVFGNMADKKGGKFEKRKRNHCDPEGSEEHRSRPGVCNGVDGPDRPFRKPSRRQHHRTVSVTMRLWFRW